MISAQTTLIMELVSEKFTLKIVSNTPLDVTMVQRGPTYVMSSKEGLPRTIGGEPTILALGPSPMIYTLRRVI